MLLIVLVFLVPFATSCLPLPASLLFFTHFCEGFSRQTNSCFCHFKRKPAARNRPQAGGGIHRLSEGPLSNEVGLYWGSESGCSPLNFLHLTRGNQG